MVSSLDLKALNIFLSTPVSHDMIHKLVVSTLQILPCQDSKVVNDKPLPSLMTFLTKLVRYTNVYTGTLMATLVYLNKLKSKLPKNAQGLPCTRHRIVLSCLILASKFHNDSSPKNIHWAKYTEGLFTTKDINLMERQLIYLLNWDLKVENEEMVEVLDSFLDPIRSDLINSQKMRKYLREQKERKEDLRIYSNTYSPSRSTNSLSPRSPSGMSRSPSNTMLKSPSNSSNISRSSISRPSTSRSSSLSLQTIQSQPHYDHYRQNSSSSISSVSSTSSLMDEPCRSLTPVDPLIEMTALNEEKELNKLLKRLNNSSHLQAGY
jgi:G1/S-specific cyclin PLC1